VSNAVNFSDATPAAPAGGVNVRFQSDGNGNISAYAAKSDIIGGLVSSVFGRSGDVAAAAGDYNAAQVLYAVDQRVFYPDPAFVASLAWPKITGAPTSAQLAGLQTPWAQSIDAAGHNLSNLDFIQFAGSGTQAIISAGILGLQPASSLYLTPKGNLYVATGPSLTQRLSIDTAGHIAIAAADDAAASLQVTGVITATAKVGIGLSAPGYPLDVYGGAASYVARFAPSANMPNARIGAPSNGNTAGLYLFNDDVPTKGAGLSMGGIPGTSPASGDFVLSTYASGGSWLDRVHIQNSSGFVGINNAAPGYQLDVGGGARISASLETGLNDAGAIGGVSANIYFNGSNWIYRAAGAGALMIATATQAILYGAAAGAAGAIVTLTRALTMQGGVGAFFSFPLAVPLNAPGSAPAEALIPNSGAMLALASNTSLVFRVRGSDGVIRQAALTLA
jgi:hypothetical protein